MNIYDIEKEDQQSLKRFNELKPNVSRDYLKINPPPPEEETMVGQQKITNAKLDETKLIVANLESTVKTISDDLDSLKAKYEEVQKEMKRSEIKNKLFSIFVAILGAAIGAFLGQL